MLAAAAAERDEQRLKCILPITFNSLQPCNCAAAAAAAVNTHNKWWRCTLIFHRSECLLHARQRLLGVKDEMPQSNDKKKLSNK
jgi:hypothetical protein